MTDNILIDLSMDFSVKIVKLCETIKGKSILTNQVLRSGTSIGANIHEANYAHSRADFISKMQIALKECYESEYWLKLFVKTDIITNETYNWLRNDCGKIRKILISSINTAKANNKNQDFDVLRDKIKRSGWNAFVLDNYIILWYNTDSKERF